MDPSRRAALGRFRVPKCTQSGVGRKPDEGCVQVGDGTWDARITNASTGRQYFLGSFRERADALRWFNHVAAKCGTVAIS